MFRLRCRYFQSGPLEPLKVMIEIPETDLAFVRDGVAAQFAPMRCRIVSSTAG